MFPYRNVLARFRAEESGESRKGVSSLSYQTKPALCKLIQEVLLDINELNDTKAMVDKDHLTHMLDMVFRVDILQRDLVIIKTHTVVGRKERLIFYNIIQT